MSFFSRTPLAFFGLGLSSAEKEIFDKLKMEVEEYIKAPDMSEQLIMLICTSFNDTASLLGFEGSVPVLKQLFTFIRHRLLDGNTDQYKRLMYLLDSFVRQCGIRAQVMVGRKKFLQAVSLTARRYKTYYNSECQSCAALGLDCLQAWGEAFGPHKDVFPFYEEIYLKCKNKYNVLFPRPDHDPSRIPIRIDLSPQWEETNPFRRLFEEDMDASGANTKDELDGELTQYNANLAESMDDCHVFKSIPSDPNMDTATEANSSSSASSSPPTVKESSKLSFFHFGRVGSIWGSNSSTNVLENC
jgi:hypothetical protein